MYRYKPGPGNTIQIVYTDLQTGKTTMSPLFKRKIDALGWIVAHGRSLHSEDNHPQPPRTEQRP